MGRLSVEVVYATRDTQEIVRLTLEPGACAIDAVRLSGLQKRHPGTDLLEPKVGIFGIRIPLDTLLKDGDRVEVYRPLQIDPKEERRNKAAARLRAKS